MAEAVRPDPAVSASKEASLSSAKPPDLPPIPQRRALGELTPSGSDTFDFGSNPSSPCKQRAADGDAPDYLNGGLPHDEVSPAWLNGDAHRPGSLNYPGPSSSTDPIPLTAEPLEIPTPPPGRRSVQFARNDVVVDTPSHSRNASWDAKDAIGKLRGSAIMSKLKELTALSTPQGYKSPGSELGSTASSPTTTRQSSRVLGDLDEDSEDADAEETADETVVEDAAKTKKKKKRRIRRPRPRPNAGSTPATPRLTAAETDTPAGPRRLMFTRRNTMPDSTGHRGGMSEGEGRDHFGERPSRGSIPWMSSRGDQADEGESPSGRRVGHLRRISAFGAGGAGGASDGDTPRRPFFTGERASTFGVQKWRQVKNTIKLLRQKKEERFDYYKSAELMAELRAGAPAVLMLASMIQRDEHGNKRIPVLLEQLKLSIRDSTPVQDGDSERHWLFTIDLEYGSGPSRMKWTVKRTIREILNLHWKYKLTLGNEKYLTSRLDLGARPKQPKFPLSAFPYLRGVRGVDDEDDADQASVRGADETAAEATAGEGTAAEYTATENEGRPQPRRKSRMNVLGGRRRPSVFGDFGGSNADLSHSALDPTVARRRYVERQQRMLEKYLQETIRWLMFRADSNRLCRFLELSALGVRLAAEGSYHGKECYLHIQSSKGIDFRRVLTPGRMIARHTRKWFLVRQSYIVCVESPENMNIYDVYLVDPKFKIISKKSKLKQITSPRSEGEEIDLTVEPPPEKHHTLKILTSERKVKLFSRNQHIMRQFEESITEMLKATPWHLNNRFGSFGPVRTGVHAQWLVDGRDYMWNVSRALNMARDVIYIHDWWLSPELYMRRPAAISQKWRLDRLLQRKAREGVKVFIIVYRNVEAAIPIDSEYTKFSLLNLHPNIFVQRSPNQFKKNQFFFAHHEKVCIVDHDVAFVGGIDLCFGRWDCPQHPVSDDKPTGFEPQDSPKDAGHCQLFPGKDYSNPRVQDFFRLNEPYEEMYDRGRIPRMPWHDVSMQVVGQPARDLTRHFVQRWNYVRRGRNPTRPTPFLLPPPDYKTEDLEALGLTGTCEVQILRSATTWSLGIDNTEISIQSAYIKMIEDSDHFVYIENQFFITSTETMNTRISNRIGDAFVNRIIRAHENEEDWRAVILMPLMPGFQNEVNDQDGTSVRLILQCQYRSICRGEHSIFGRLRAAGIEPEDYIQFFSLRQWGKIGHNVLTTEQLYIHAKVIIVDDRVALIGSANINERSMLGTRDSECAAIVRDTDTIWSTMAGRPYRVGRFAHTLRLRLMREHLGLDVDEILEEERQADMDREAEFTSEMDDIYSENEGSEPVAGSSKRKESKRRPESPLLTRTSSFNYDVDLIDTYDGRKSPSVKGKSVERDVRVTDNEAHKREVEGYGPDRWKSAEPLGLDQGRDSTIINGREVLLHNVAPEGRGTVDYPKTEQRPRSASEIAAQDSVGNHGVPPMPPFDRRTTEQLGLPRANQLPTLPIMDDTDIGGPPAYLDAANRPTHTPQNPLTADVQPAAVDKDCMRDPLNAAFYDGIWSKTAENNTKIFRRVFRCMPDSEVTNWTEYKEFKTYSRRFKESMDSSRTSDEPDRKSDGISKQAATGAGIGAPGPAAIAKSMAEKISPSKLTANGTPTAIGHEREHDLDEKTRPYRASDEPARLRGDSINDLEKRPTSGEGNTERASADIAQVLSEGGDKLEVLKPDARKERRTTFSTPEEPPTTATSGCSSAAPGTANTNTNTNASGDGGASKTAAGSQRRGRRRAATKGSRRGFSAADELLSRAEAEELLNLSQGALVQFPYDWLVVEEMNGNWLFQVDQVAPLQIYT